MKGLNWGEIKFRKAKKELLKLELIEKVIQRNNKNKIKGWYIKLNYLWKKETLSKNPEIKDQENQGLNAYSANNKNAYSANSLLPKGNKKAFPKETPILKKNLFLEHWNSLKESYPMIQQHKNSSTKVYQNAAKMIKHLMNGTFEDFVSIDHKFLKRNHIPLSLLSHKWTRREIINCIDRLPKLFVNGYWPYDKKKLPRNLNSLIYNSRTNTSFFLLVKQHPPKLNGQEKSDEQIDNEEKYMTTGTWTEEEMQEHIEKLEREQNY